MQDSQEPNSVCSITVRSVGGGVVGSLFSHRPNPASGHLGSPSEIYLLSAGIMSPLCLRPVPHIRPLSVSSLSSETQTRGALSPFLGDPGQSRMLLCVLCVPSCMAPLPPVTGMGSLALKASLSHLILHSRSVLYLAVGRQTPCFSPSQSVCPFL